MPMRALHGMMTENDMQQLGTALCHPGALVTRSKPLATARTVVRRPGTALGETGVGHERISTQTESWGSQIPRVVLD
jgi:hypothetical protein